LKPTAAIDVKILSLGAPERYAIRRLLTAALGELQAQFPRLSLHISEIDDSSEIGKYASTLILPTLVINERVVCSGQYPSKEAVIDWLRQAME
jgi:hypothetical protein